MSALSKRRVLSPVERLHERLYDAPKQPMENDELTPPCRFCGETHVGVHTSCYMMLRGAYAFSPDLGCAIFVLDPDVGIEVTQLPNGKYALIVDVDTRDSADKPAAVTHEECVTRLLEEIGHHAMEDDEDELHDDDDDDDEDEDEFDLFR